MKRNLFVLILVLQSAWVLYTVAMQEYALREGATVLLETRPVDPRDLLRGDYVILNYKISSLPTNLVQSLPADNLDYGQTIWVALSQHGEFHEISRVATERFAPETGEVLLRARCAFAGRPPLRPGQQAQREVRLEYGLERYFVREGTGNPQGKLTVQAVVPASGRASIKQVFVDGKPYAEAMKEQSR